MTVRMDLLPPTIFLFFLIELTWMLSKMSSTPFLTISTVRATFLFGVNFFSATDFSTVVTLFFLFPEISFFLVVFLALVGVDTFLAGVFLGLRASFFLSSFFFLFFADFLFLVFVLTGSTRAIIVSVLTSYWTWSLLLTKLPVIVSNNVLRNMLNIIFRGHNIIILLSWRLCLQYVRLVVQQIFINILFF